MATIFATRVPQDKAALVARPSEEIARVYIEAAPENAASMAPASHEVARAYVEKSTDNPRDMAVGDNCLAVDPTEVKALIRSIASEEGMDADLAEAVAGVESDGGARPGLSSAGAAGVMQLMPATALELGVVDRCDTASNIRGGVRYLNSLITEFGDPVLALSAYNAGPGTVYKASGIPLNNETVKYVAKVLNRWKYSSMLSAGKAKPAEDHGHADGNLDDSNSLWRDGHVIDF